MLKSSHTSLLHNPITDGDWLWMRMEYATLEIVFCFMDYFLVVGSGYSGYIADKVVTVVMCFKDRFKVQGCTTTTLSVCRPLFMIIKFCL